MADKRIQDLTPASSVQTSDRFVLEQSGQAKSLTGQILINDLAAALDGHGGISDISYTPPTSGSLTGTLTITFADETEETFSVTNGRGIESVADKWAVSSSNSTEPSTWYDDPQTMTVENRYEWHYQNIAFNDGTSIDTDAAVVGVYGDTGDADHVYIRWANASPTQDSDVLNYPSDWIGICTTTDDSAPTDYTRYSWFQYKGETGDTGNGITSVTLDSSSGLVDTYKILFDDNTFTTFDVTNGSDIDTIEKTASSGLMDTYTVTLTNGDATTFNVFNGKGIASITAVDVTHVAGHTDVYRFNFNDGDTYSFSIYNGMNGSGSVSTVDEIPSNNQNVPLLLLGSGAPTTLTPGLLKQRYFDQTNSILYICTGIDASGSETTYTWQGSGVTVDSVLSTLSTNPVQNAVITAVVGTGTLNTTAQNLVGAVNEVNNKIGSTALPTTAQTVTGAIAELDGDISSVVSNKVSKSGDTITGTITSERGADAQPLVLKNTSVTVGTAPSSNNYQSILFTDNIGNVLGGIKGGYTTDKRRTLKLYTQNSLGEENYLLIQYLTSSNNDQFPHVSVSAPHLWRQALGIGNPAGNFPITVAQGGTGATTASDALSNLGGVPLVVITNMSANTSSALTTALTNSNSSIPTGVSMVQCGNSTVGCRALVICAKINANLGRGYVVSAYAINGSTVTLGTGGTWS